MFDTQPGSSVGSVSVATATKTSVAQALLLTLMVGVTTAMLGISVAAAAVKIKSLTNPLEVQYATDFVYMVETIRNQEVPVYVTDLRPSKDIPIKEIHYWYQSNAGSLVLPEHTSNAKLTLHEFNPDGSYVGNRVVAQLPQVELGGEWDHYVIFSFPGDAPLALRAGQSYRLIFTLKINDVAPAGGYVQFGHYPPQHIITVNPNDRSTSAVGAMGPIVTVLDQAYLRFAVFPISGQPVAPGTTVRLCEFTTEAHGTVLKMSGLRGGVSPLGKGQIVPGVALGDILSNFRIVGITQNGQQPIEGPKAMPNNPWQFSFSRFTGPPATGMIFEFEILADLNLTSTSTIAVDELQVLFDPQFTTASDLLGRTARVEPTGFPECGRIQIRRPYLNVRHGVLPVASSVTAGTQDAALATLELDATESATDLLVYQIRLLAQTTSPAAIDSVTNLEILENGTVLATGEPVGGVAQHLVEFNFGPTVGTPIVIHPGELRTLEIRGDIEADAVAGTYQIGLAQSPNVIVLANVPSPGFTYYADITYSDGPVMTFEPAAPSTLIISNNANTPAPALVPSGVTGYTVNRVKLTSDREDLLLNELTIRVEDGRRPGTADGNYQDIANVTLYSGGNKLAESNIPASGQYKFTFSSDPSNANYLLIPKNGGVEVEVKVDTAEISPSGTNNPGTPNADFILGFGGADGVKATGKSSGTVASNVYLSSTSTTKILHSAIPIVTLPTPSNRLGAASALTNGDVRLFAFDVTADSTQGRPVMLYRFSFNVTSSTQTDYNLDLANFYLKQDGVGSKISSADIPALTYYGGAPNGGGILTFIFNSPDYSEGDVGEQIEVPAGATKRFYLYGTVTGASASKSVSVSLLGDVAASSALFTWPTGAPAENFGFSRNGKFVWSDDHKNLAGTTDATEQPMWFNGDLVHGLEHTITTTPYTISF